MTEHWNVRGHSYVPESLGSFTWIFSSTFDPNTVLLIEEKKTQPTCSDPLEIQVDPPNQMRGFLSSVGGPTPS